MSRSTPIPKISLPLISLILITTTSVACSGEEDSSTSATTGATTPPTSGTSSSGGASGGSTTSGGGTTSGSTTSGSTTGGTSPAQTTWYADASPVLQTHCTRCHWESGPGTGDFTDYATASAMAEVMVNQIDVGQMPPPASDPTCQDYHASDALWMPDDATDTLRAWVEDDTPMGDPSTAVTVDAIDGALSDPDLEIYMPAAYTPTFSDASNPGNEYRCFVIDLGLEEDTYVTAAQPIIDNTPMVHHVVLYTMTSSEVDESYLAPEGFSCINGEEYRIVRELVGGWAPGGLPIELPDGVGMQLDAGERLVVQMHYFDPGTLGEDTSDRSGYAFRLTDEVKTEAWLEAFGVYDFRIPAGDEDYAASGSTRLSVRQPRTLYSVLPHMHVLGRAYSMYAENEKGDQTCLVESEGYSFENQVQYMFKEPVVIEGGSYLHYECRWNNSESNPNLIHHPPIDTTYGERTDEEMCIFFALVSE